MELSSTTENASVATIVGRSSADLFRISLAGNMSNRVQDSGALGSILTVAIQNRQIATNPLGVTGRLDSSRSSFSLSANAFPTMQLSPLAPTLEHTGQMDSAASINHVTNIVNLAAGSTIRPSFAGSTIRPSFRTRRTTRSITRAARRADSESHRASTRSTRLGSSRLTPLIPKESPRRRSSTRRKRVVKEEEIVSPPSKKRRSALKMAPPDSTAGLKKETTEEGRENSPSCCICMSEPKPIDLASINGCTHLFCFDCIEKWGDRENTCPLCKIRFTKIERVNKRKKGEPKIKNSKRVKQKDQRSDIAPGAALEGLLASLTANPPYPSHRVARLIFSGMGNPFFQISAGRQPSPFSPRRTRPNEQSAGRTATLDDSPFSVDTEDEEAVGYLGGVNPPVSTFSELIRAIPRSSGFVMGGAPVASNGRVQVLRPMSFSHYPTSRSYATNVSDQSAGLEAENPLEIDDTDDEGEVEVIQVTRPV